MFGYVTLGTNDFDRSVAFYDELLATLGIRRLWASKTMAAWGRSRQEPALSVTAPFDGEPATVGNGVMLAIKLETHAQVDAFHAKALELGGQDDGAPGPRGDQGFYGGYFRDPDGNKLNGYVPAS